jgi:hypothetical protein
MIEKYGVGAQFVFVRAQIMEHLFNVVKAVSDVDGRDSKMSDFVRSSDAGGIIYDQVKKAERVNYSEEEMTEIMKEEEQHSLEMVIEDVQMAEDSRKEKVQGDQSQISAD